MEEVSGRARSFGKVPKTNYENAMINVTNRVTDFSDKLSEYSKMRFYFNKEQDLRNANIVDAISVEQARSLSFRVEDTFYTIIGSIEMIALSLLYIYNNDLKSPYDILKNYTVESVYPYYMCYYFPGGNIENDDKLDIKLEEDVLKFVNFSLSLSENIKNIMTLPPS